jgi:hypothetical protein
MKRLATISIVVAGSPTIRTRSRAAGEWRPAMDHVGIDVHKRESQICILAEDGVTEARIVTSPERFREVLGGRDAIYLLDDPAEVPWKHSLAGTAALAAHQ